MQKATDSVHSTETHNFRLAEIISFHHSSLVCMDNQQTMAQTLLFFLNSQGSMLTWLCTALQDAPGLFKQTR